MKCSSNIKMYLLVGCTFYIGYVCSGQTIQDMKDLLNDKLADYNNNIRPVANQSAPIEVYLSLSLISLFDVDEVTQTVTALVMIPQYWSDASMPWDPANYGGLDTFFVDKNLFWTPPLIMFPVNNKVTFFGSSEKWNIRIINYGVCFYYPADITYISCPMDLTYFPFDEHECMLIISTWGLLTDELIMHNTSSTLDIGNLIQHGQWEVLKSEMFVDTSSDGPVLIANLRLKRLPSFVIVNIILPLIFLSFLNILVFLIPAESGERISYCLTLLLSIAVFLTIVNDDLPKVSIPMPFFSYYLLSILALSVAMTVAILFSLRIYFSDDSKPVGKGWKRFVLLLRFQCVTRIWKTRESDQDTSQEYNRNTVQHMTAEDNVTLKSNPGCPSGKDQVRNAWRPHTDSKLEHGDGCYTLDTTITEQSDGITWKNVSITFDMLCFVVFSIILIVTTIAMFTVLRKGSD